MLALTTSITARAARAMSPPNGSAIVAMASRARSGSSEIDAPRIWPGCRRPSTTWASVTVGSAPRP